MGYKNNEILIRRFKPKDSDSLEKLFVAMEVEEKIYYEDRADPEKVKDAYVKDIINETKGKDGLILVAQIHGEVVGYIAGKVEFEIENKHKYFRIWDLSVLPNFRGKGVGSLLLNKLEHCVDEMGIKKIGMGVLSGNTRAYELYKRLGYKDYSIDLIKDVEIK